MVLLKCHLTEEEESYQNPFPAETFVVDDGNHDFYYVKLVPENFIKISSHVFDMMPKQATLYFVPTVRTLALLNSWSANDRDVTRNSISKERTINSLKIRENY